MSLNNKSQKDIEEILSSIEVPIPTEFDETIDTVLKSLPYKRSRLITNIGKIAAIFVIIIVGLGFGIRFNENFAAFAKEIPGLDFLTEFITASVGSENAMQNGYPVRDPIIIKDGDYTLTLKGLTVDEGRITFNAYLDGPKFNQDNILQLTDDGDIIRYDYRVYLINKHNTITSASFGKNHKQSTVIYLGDYDQDYIKSVIKSNEGLEFGCKIYKKIKEESQQLHAFKPFKVDISNEDVLWNKEASINHKVDFEKGSIIVNKLIMSPTNMELITTSELKEGVDNIGLYDITYKDNSELNYRSSSVSIIYHDDLTKRYLIEPSNYFERSDTLNLLYKGYYYSLPPRDYTLNMKNSFPKKFNYGKYQFIIKDAYYNGNDLVITHTTNLPDEFDVQSITIDKDISGNRDEKVTTQDTKKVKEKRVIFENFKKMDQINFRLCVPKIFVKKQGSIKINLQ